MTNAILNNELIATVAGNITVYNFDGVTREYFSSSVEYLAIGVGLPANSCTDTPPQVKTGKAICRSAGNSDWEYLADHRGETVYNTETGEPVEITVPGDYPTGTTMQAPTTPYDKWDGSTWVTDADAQQAAQVAKADQQKKLLLESASLAISDWKAELGLGIISDEDKASLTDWLAYIKAVKAIDTSTAPDITWPIQPEV